MGQGMSRRSPFAGIAAILLFLVAMPGLGACTTQKTEVKATVQADTPSATAIQPAGPSAVPKPAREFSPDSITVMDQRTVDNETGRHIELQVKAPANTRFLIGNINEDTGSIPCTSKMLDGTEVLYEVSCPDQEPTRKLFAIITFGDFDYGFTKSLH